MLGALLIVGLFAVLLRWFDPMTVVGIMFSLFGLWLCFVLGA